MGELSERIRNRLGTSAGAVYFAMAILIVGLTLLAPVIGTVYDASRALFPPVVYALFAVAAIAAFAFLAPSRNGAGISRFLAIGSVALFAIQYVIVASTYYVTDWDPREVFEIARIVTENGDLKDYIWYIDRYPNNYTLVYLIHLTIRAAYIIGCDPLFLSALTGAALCNVAVLLTALSIFKVTESSSTAKAFWVVGALLAGLSPWIDVPYSDTYSIALTAAAIFFLTYASSSGKTAIRLAFLLLFWMSVLFGYLIKPSIVILAVAAAMAFALVRLGRIPVVASLGSCALCAIVAALVCFGIAAPKAAESIEALYTPNAEKAFSLHHYLMMGANSEYGGFFNFDDVEFSASIEAKEERQRTEMQVYQERIAAMGPAGYASFLASKLACTFCDGTFGSGVEGSGYVPTGSYPTDEAFEPVTSALRSHSFYSQDHPTILSESMHIAWFGVLLLCPGAFRLYLRLRKTDRKKSLPMLTAMLACIGLVIFLALFESRARYLFCFLPLFLFLASFGMAECLRIANTVKSRRKASRG